MGREPVSKSSPSGDNSPLRVGVDVGGTFTDLVAVAGSQITTIKVLSTPQPELGVLQALEQLEAQWAKPLVIQQFAHGMTVATNALLERKGSPTLFLTTAGFTDVLAIGRQNRPALYDLTQPKPQPLVPRHLCWGVEERCSVSGVIQPLTEQEIERTLAWVEAQRLPFGIEAVAIGFLFSFLYPEHETKLAAALRHHFPDLHLSLSCQVAPEFREYERFSTTVIDAYLSPKLAGYLHRLGLACQARQWPLPWIMQSSGGVAPLGEVAAHASLALLSGPAAGLYGAAWLAQQSGFNHLLTLDMGGTSTDVALMRGGDPQQTAQAVVCGFPVLQPQMDIHTVSAGGGSLAQVGRWGGLRVGPESAGSNPGPACYGLGGREACVTDANLWLGYLPDGALLGGSVRLQRQRAEVALQGVAEALGLNLVETACGIRTLANIQMSRALRVISVERGWDPADFALMAFGGAGPLHACSLAAELGIPIILIPPTAGLLSALGMALSQQRRDYRRAILQPLSPVVDPWTHYLVPLIEQAEQDFHQPSLAISMDLRYQGQSFELTLPVAMEQSRADVIEAFHQAHQQRYGWRDPQQTIQWVNLRLSATQGFWSVPAVTFSSTSSFPLTTPPGERSVWVGSTWQIVPVYQPGHLWHQDGITGPAIIEMVGSTAWIEAGWQAEMDAHGLLVVGRV